MLNRFSTALRLLPLLFLAACADDQLHNTLTVINGQGSGVYALGETVRITADSAANGMAFTHWRGDTALLLDARAPITELAMPLHDVRLEAVFEALPTYQLTVINGSGSGRYLPGTPVLVQALPPADTLSFTVWVGDVTFMPDDDEALTTFTMPERDAQIEARFQPNNLVSFQAQIMPLFQSRCLNCHGADDNTPYTNHAEIAGDAGDIRESLLSDYMPPGNPLPQGEKELIYTWILQGKKNN